MVSSGPSVRVRVAVLRPHTVDPEEDWEVSVALGAGCPDVEVEAVLRRARRVVRVRLAFIVGATGDQDQRQKSRESRDEIIDCDFDLERRQGYAGPTCDISEQPIVLQYR